jgi:hypothetical protein
MFSALFFCNCLPYLGLMWHRTELPIPKSDYSVNRTLVVRFYRNIDATKVLIEILEGATGFIHHSGKISKFWKICSQNIYTCKDSIVRRGKAIRHWPACRTPGTHSRYQKHPDLPGQ